MAKVYYLYLHNFSNHIFPHFHSFIFLHTFTIYLRMVMCIRRQSGGKLQHPSTLHKFQLNGKLIIVCSFFCFFSSSTASRLIRRRVPAAGHFMTPRRLWLNKIPTQCDVVLEFPGKFNFYDY